MRCTLIALLLGAAAAQGQSFLGKTAVAWQKDLDQGADAARRNAAYALGKLGTQAVGAVPALTTKLRDDKNAKVREAVAVALGEIGKASRGAADPKLSSPLSAALKDDDALVRRSAAYALGQLGADAAPAQTALDGALGDPKGEVRQNAAWALARIGAAAVPSLRKALRDTDPLVKRDAAAGMAQIDPEAMRSAIGELIALCGESNTEVRKAALNVLAKIVGPDDAAAAKPIHQALADKDPEVRRNAAMVLSNIGGKDALAGVPILLETLRRGDVEQRRLAAMAIRNIGEEAHAAVPDLIKALADPDDETRTNAALALGGIGAKAEPAVAALVQVVANAKETSDTRVEAAVSLSRIGPVAAAVEAVPDLLRIVQDTSQDAKVRWRIVWALRVHKGKLRDVKEFFPTLAKVIAEPLNREKDNKMLRYDCAYMLGVFQQKEAPDKTLDVLSEFLRDDEVALYVQTKTSVQGGTQETGVGKAKAKEVGASDGRVMAVQALTYIGAGRVTARPEIMQQLRALAEGKEVDSTLREECKKLLKSLN